jgi:phosphatidylserine/phosphatidylglycerophosphate/cardiolipin synthase-like enzyme
VGCESKSFSTRSTRAPEALAELIAHVETEGRADLLTVTPFRDDAPWAHLKVLTVDSDRAYIGSANVTRPGLGRANLEMGVLVKGSKVRIIEEILDLFREP